MSTKSEQTALTEKVTAHKARKQAGAGITTAGDKWRNGETVIRQKLESFGPKQQAQFLKVWDALVEASRHNEYSNGNVNPPMVVSLLKKLWGEAHPQAKEANRIARRSAPAPVVEIDYDKLAEAMDKRRSK